MKTARYSARGRKHFLHINLFTHFARKISRWLWVQEKALLVLHSISLWEYTQKRSGLRKAQMEHSSHIVKVGVETTCLQFNPWCILKEKTEPAGFDPPFRWTMINISKYCNISKNIFLNRTPLVDASELNSNISNTNLDKNKKKLFQTAILIFWY